jgi:hypothetical protein
LSSAEEKGKEVAELGLRILKAGLALGGWGVDASGSVVHGGLEAIIVAAAKGAFPGTGLADMKMSEMKELNQKTLCLCKYFKTTSVISSITRKKNYLLL